MSTPAASAAPSRRGAGAAEADRAEPAPVPVSWRWRVSNPALVALLVGLLVTAALSATTLVLYNRSERRLLNLRMRELGLVLSSALPATQTPLASAATLADATGGDAAKFRSFLAPYVGAGRQFESVSLWPLHRRVGAPLAVVGAPAATPAGVSSAVLALARRRGVLNLRDLLDARRPSLGFVYAVPSAAARYAVYAEVPLPADRRSKLEKNSAFSDLQYVLYLGRSRSRRNLLLTSESSLPVHGLQASQQVPFGAAKLTLLVTPRGSLSGTFFAALPWITAVVGVLISLAAAILTDRLARRRRRAEELATMLDQVAAENRERYIEQRSIAQTLQHALLPARLPQPDGLRVGARYVPAQSGGDIGGDWYDFVPLAPGRALLVIGDVSGHGIEAATTMALLRHATLAYVAREQRPAAVLGMLADFVRGRAHDYFATVLCALVEIDAHRLTVASAGHLPPLLMNGGEAEFVRLQPDPPIGFQEPTSYHEAGFAVPPHATLLAFTDGLVERRGEVLDEGLERLRVQALAGGGRDLLARLAGGLTSGQHRDDTALVSIEWQK